MKTYTKTITLYEFDELDEQAKERARDWYREGALDYDWWDCTYEDANTIGLKIEGFDLDRSRHAKGHLLNSGLTVCKAIMKEHGQSCDTYKLALEYINGFATLEAYIEREDDQQGDYEEQLDEHTAEFEKDLLEEYSIMLQHEYEYLMSDESVDESIRANEYTLTESGERED